jgi:hypothetical protein
VGRPKDRTATDKHLASNGRPGAAKGFPVILLVGSCKPGIYTDVVTRHPQQTHRRSDPTDPATRPKLLDAQQLVAAQVVMLLAK